MKVLLAIMLIPILFFSGCITDTGTDGDAMVDKHITEDDALDILDEELNDLDESAEGLEDELFSLLDE